MTNPFTTPGATYADLAALQAKVNGQVVDAGETTELKAFAVAVQAWLRGANSMDPDVLLRLAGGAEVGSFLLKPQTMAELALLGGLTFPPVAVGTVAWATDEDQFVVCRVANDGDSQWHVPNLRRTLAALQALGSGTVVKVAAGDTAFDTTGQGGAVCVWTEAAGSVWVHAALRRGLLVHNHWHHWDETDADGFVQISASGGVVQTIGTAGVDATHPGILSTSIDLTLNSRAGIRPAGSLGTGGVVLGTLPVISEWIERHDTLPTAITDEFRVYSGQVTNISTVEPSDGDYFILDASSGNWFAKSATASTRTSTDTGVAGTINTWRTFRIEATATRVRFWIDGALVATHTTNIYAGVRLPIAHFMHRYLAGGGTVNRLVDLSHFEQVTGVAA